MNNVYVKIQKNYNLRAVTLFKGICVAVLSYLFLNPPGNIGAVGAIGVIYCIIVLTLFINVILRR